MRATQPSEQYAQKYLGWDAPERASRPVILRIILRMAANSLTLTSISRSHSNNTSKKQEDIFSYRVYARKDWRQAFVSFLVNSVTRRSAGDEVKKR